MGSRTEELFQQGWDCSFDWVAHGGLHTPSAGHPHFCRCSSGQDQSSRILPKGFEAPCILAQGHR